MLRVHLQVYVNVGKLKSTLMVSLSQYYKPCLTRSLYYKLCYCRAIFEVVTALFDLEYFIKRFCMCNSSYRGIPQNLFYA